MTSLTTDCDDGVDPKLEMRYQRLGRNGECASEPVPYLTAAVQPALDAGQSGRTHPSRLRKRNTGNSPEHSPSSCGRGPAKERVDDVNRVPGVAGEAYRCI